MQKRGISKSLVGPKTLGISALYTSLEAAQDFRGCIRDWDWVGRVTVLLLWVSGVAHCSVSDSKLGSTNVA